MDILGAPVTGTYVHLMCARTAVPAWLTLILCDVCVRGASLVSSVKHNSANVSSLLPVPTVRLAWIMISMGTNACAMLDIPAEIAPSQRLAFQTCV